MSEILLYIDSHLVGKRAKRIFSRRMRMVFGFGLNHTSESSVRAKYTIYLPSFLAAIHYYVAFPFPDILFITKDPLLVPQESCSVDVHPECSVMDIHRGIDSRMAATILPKFNIIQYHLNLICG
jgi:hypothetical protein